MTSEQEGLKPRFGDIIENGWASLENPTRCGYFVREGRRTGKMNAGRYFEVTDGRGKFWELPLGRDHKISVRPVAWNRRTHTVEGDRARITELEDALLRIAVTDRHYRAPPKPKPDGGLRGWAGRIAIVALTKQAGSCVTDDEVRSALAQIRTAALTTPADGLLPGQDGASNSPGANHVPVLPDKGEAGWMLVPIEPTPEMVRAGAQAIDDLASDPPLFHSEDDDAEVAYRAMLKAAPTPERGGK